MANAEAIASGVKQDRLSTRAACVNRRGEEDDVESDL